jgi:DNA-binding transcriptional regulator YhcF (GntR family)
MRATSSFVLNKHDFEVRNTSLCCWAGNPACVACDGKARWQFASTISNPKFQISRLPICLTLYQRVTRIRATQKNWRTNRVTFKIRINRKSVESMTRQITDQLGSLIGSGGMAVGSLLPSERSLANSLGVARNVVRGSYEYLEKAGVVQREGRKGRRVRAKTSPAKTASRKTAKKGAKKR